MNDKISRLLGRPPSAVAVSALAFAYGGGLWMQILHQAEGGSEHRELPLLLHWWRDATLALPLMIVAVLVGFWLARSVLTRWGEGGSPQLAHVVTAAIAATVASAFLGAASPIHTILFEAHHGHELPVFVHMGRDSLLALAANLALAGLIAAPSLGVPGTLRRHARRGAPSFRRLTVRLATASASLSLIVPPALAPARPVAAVPIDTAVASCSAATVDRAYDVVATNVTIPYNRWGDANPNGQVYVLRGDKAAVVNWSLPLNADPGQDPAGNRRLRPRPLVLRANAGECIKVIFTNELNEVGGDGLPNDPRASIHIHGAAYDAQTSGGSMVGFNADTTVSNNPGTNQIVYYWTAPLDEGLYFFHDHGALAGSEADGGSNAHGLFGVLAVEPAGSTWTAPVNGQPLYLSDGSGMYTRTSVVSGDPYIDADIHPPAGKSFREFVQLAQDEIPGSIGFGFNYGAEPGRKRDAHRCPDCLSEETSLSSWPYGDPALIKLASGPGPWLPQATAEDCGLPDSCWVANVSHAYPGDPTKIRFGMAGVKETHVFHLHAHQWLAEPKDVGAMPGFPGRPSDTNRPESTTIDSQTFGPNEMFTAELLFGAGSQPGTVGDSIFHCHLYPHFADGFWALFRVHDVRENGSQTTPDGIKVRALEPLPGGTVPPAPTPATPGFPRFIPGAFGWRGPQPPLGVTEGGPAGPAATRIVAGQQLDPARVAIEQSVIDAFNAQRGTTPKPGAPFTDPCPAGAREVTYNVSAIQLDIVYNEAGWHDTQGRILVLDQDVEAVLAGTKEPEPFFFRVNAGDCVNFNLTNRFPNWIGADAFQILQQTNMVGEHIHLVKFDVLASDGTSNGWNYVQAAFTREQMDFNAAVLAGTQPCDVAGGCRIADPASWDPTTKTGPNNVGQTIHERWYADYELRTVFTHDHHFPAIDQNRGLFAALIVEPRGMDFRNPKTGAFYQPIDSTSNGPVCGIACEGTAAGTMMDVIGPGAKDDFREFSLAFQDFVLLTRAGGDPRNPADTFNPPLAPEVFPDEDPGVMGINYRNAPFLLRDTKNGQPVDPAYRFSSTWFGDPKTPLLQAYAGDPVRLRLIQGAQEEQHVFTMHGLRWREEPDDPESPYVNARAVGVSEAFNFEVPRLSCTADEPCRGDFLYASTGLDDLYLGMWGLMRVYGTTFSGLLPLPDNPPPRTGPLVGTICPAEAPVRHFDVVAMEARLDYNQYGDHDPYGLTYALAEDEAAIRAGTKKPDPLVLRANEGDCVEVSLTNKLSTAFLNHTGAADGDARVPLEPPAGTRAGLRVSLHPQLVRYDVRNSDGATIGFNQDQTVGPGQSIVYRWYADDVTPGELGAINLTDFGDVRGHRHHGLFAALVVEPKGATYHDPLTGAEIVSGASADIRVPGMPDFREFNLLFQDGLNLRDSAGVPIPDLVDPLEPLDAEDQGEKAFNYANAPFRHRLGFEPVDHPAPDGTALAHVFSSNLHGDPKTPIFRAYAGDPIRMRVLQGEDKPRQHAFQQAGHAWKMQPDDPESTLIATQGGFSVGRALNVHLPSAGGPDAFAGDYRYGCGVLFHHLSGGLWGITRVYYAPPAAAVHQPSPLTTPDDPYQANYYPLAPLEQVTIVATVFDDANGNGVRDGSEAGVAGVTVNLRASGGAILATHSTDPAGQATFYAARDTYTLEVIVPPGQSATTPTTVSVDASAENARVFQDFGLGNPPPPPPPPPSNLLVNGDFEADANNDGKPDGWSTNPRATRSNEVVHGGSYAMKHFATDNKGYRIFQTVPNLTAGTPYHFSGWTNILPTGDTFTYKIQVRWLNSTGGTITTKTVKIYKAATGGWNEAAADLVAPAGTAKARVQMVVSSLNATIFADDFVFQQK